MFFLATYSRTNGNFGDFLSNEAVFRYFVATCSRTNGNLTQNPLHSNENGIPFVRERTVNREGRDRVPWETHRESAYFAVDNLSSVHQFSLILQCNTDIHYLQIGST